MTPVAQRRATFAAIVVVALVAVGVSVWRARRSSPTAPGTPASAAAALDRMPSLPYVLVRHLGSGQDWGRLAFAPLGTPDGARFIAPLSCVRAYMAAGRGVCLTTEGLTGQAVIFDAQWRTQATLPLSGPPSRARVSRDGRYVAYTVFERGHSYADETFSTRTTIVDADTGTPLPDLESWPAWQDATPIRRTDVNYWGITFDPDGRHVFATLAFGGTPYLVRGDLVTREFRVIARDVECPSLSPDGRRLAFKRAAGLTWRLWVRDLASGAEHAIAGETRSIDDQVEWLDDARVLYQFPSDDGNNVVVADVDGDAPSRVFMREAWSPSVVR